MCAIFIHFPWGYQEKGPKLGMCWDSPDSRIWCAAGEKQVFLLRAADIGTACETSGMMRKHQLTKHVTSLEETTHFIWIQATNIRPSASMGVRQPLLACFNRECGPALKWGTQKAISS